MTERTQIAELINQAEAAFVQEFGHAPEWITAAPGRVNLIGEHVDYNAGFVLPMAINRYTVVAARRISDVDSSNVVTVHSTGMPDSISFDLNLFSPAQLSLNLGSLAQPAWGNYLLGVLAGFAKRGANIPSLQILIHSSVPVGAGLSSSAALEVAFATALESITGLGLMPTDKALLCQQAEQQFAGVPCGIMDQFVSVHAMQDHLLLLDCQNNSFEHISFADPDVAILILNSHVQHELGSSEYGLRRAQCENAATLLGVDSLRDVTSDRLHRDVDLLSEVEFRRAKHVVTEIDRTRQFAATIESSDWVTAGKLMYESHASLCNDYEVSCDELDALVNLAREIGREDGVYGSRMTGAGFGGCTVSLIQERHAAEIISKIKQSYFDRFGIKASGFVSRPMQGEMIVRHPT